MTKVLIDTSAWINFFRFKDDLVGDIVTNLIHHDNAYLTGPVIAELLHGVRGKKEKADLDIFFETIPCLQVTHNDWFECGNMLLKLREKGLAIPLTDVLIAAVAIRNEAAVLTLDKHFQNLPVQRINTNP